MKRTIIIVASLLSLVTPAYAAPFGIDVLSTSYTATVDLTLRDSATMSLTNTGPDPVSQSFGPYIENADGRYVYAVAAVSADWLAVDVSSRTLGSKILTTATSETTFRPHEDGTAEIGFDYNDDHAVYSFGFVSLFDVFTDLEVWRLTFKSIGGNVIYPDAAPIHWATGGGGSTPTLATFLDSAHTYRLNVTGHSDSQGDSTSATMRVTGLQQVPEPATLFLFGTSLAGVGLLRRRQLSPSSNRPRLKRSRSR